MEAQTVDEAARIIAGLQRDVERLQAQLAAERESLRLATDEGLKPW